MQDRAAPRTAAREPDPPTRGPWRQPSIVLLALGCLLLAAVAYQAHAAVRSHRATVDKLLTDYARTAVWNYRQHAQRELADVLEHLFHPALHGRNGQSELAVAPPLRSVLHAPHAERGSCQFAGVGELSDAARYSYRTGNVEVLGGITAGAAAEARATIARELAIGPDFRGREGLVGVNLDGRNMIAAYSRVFAPPDTLVYALFFPPERLHRPLRRALDAGTLLPDPLVGDIPTEELLVLRVGLPGSEGVLRTSEEFPDTYSATESIDGPGGVLQASIGLWPEAARHLVIGGLPRSRLPVLLALLAVAGGLLGLSFVQLKREHELAAMRTSFVASVSHELRTPLALQRVFLDTLSMGRADTDEQRDWALRNIDRESHRLSHLVENVLHFAQVEKGRVQLSMEPTELRTEIASAMREFEPLAPEVELRFEPGTGPATASLDRAAFRRILMNLIENAVKYGPADQTVTVGLSRSNGRATVTVDDQGPGIRPGDREQIWKPFERTAAARESGKGGSGIGLSLVQELVGMQAGDIAVEDSPSGGARFRVGFPLIDAAADHA